MDNFDREINKIPDSFLPGLGENLDEVNRLLDPNNINRGHVPVVELPNVREGGFDLGDRANPWGFIFRSDYGVDDDRDWQSDQQLSRGEIEVLKEAGIDIHELKGEGRVAQRDLYKDKEGNIYVKPKGGRGPGEETGLNINDF